MIENTVDAATGMVSVRALMPNADESLWPGTIVNVVLTVREDEAITVPTVAVQRSQTGNFVFVVKDGAAAVQPVEIARTYQGLSVIASGLSGGETVVTDGQLLLSNGTPVAPRTPKAGA
jgi:RND family efflux transporter MFP subunit